MAGALRSSACASGRQDITVTREYDVVLRGARVIDEHTADSIWATVALHLKCRFANAQPEPDFR